MISFCKWWMFSFPCALARGRQIHPNSTSSHSIPCSQRKFRSDVNYGQLDCRDHVKTSAATTPKSCTMRPGSGFFVGTPFAMQLSHARRRLLALLGMNPPRTAPFHHPSGLIQTLETCHFHHPPHMHQRSHFQGFFCSILLLHS